MRNRTITFMKKSSGMLKDAYSYSMAMLPGIMIMANIAAADAASDIFSAVIKVLGAFAVIKGIINGYSGFTNMADAKAEGEGPKMAKAKDEIASAIMLVVIGLAAAVFSGKFASVVTSAISF